MILPDQLRQAVDVLRNEPLGDPEALRGQVIDHLKRVRAAASDSPFVDLARAEQVAASCLLLLDDWARYEPAHQAWVQAACLYFARPTDGEDDFTSIIGFDDDADVLNHVLDRIGRADLQEP